MVPLSSPARQRTMPHKIAKKHINFYLDVKTNFLLVYSTLTLTLEVNSFLVSLVDAKLDVPITVRRRFFLLHLFIVRSKINSGLRGRSYIFFSHQCHFFSPSLSLDCYHWTFACNSRFLGRKYRRKTQFKVRQSLSFYYKLLKKKKKKPI